MDSLYINAHNTSKLNDIKLLGTLNSTSQITLEKFESKSVIRCEKLQGIHYND